MTAGDDGAVVVCDQPDGPPPGFMVATAMHTFMPADPPDAPAGSDAP